VSAKGATRPKNTPAPSLRHLLAQPGEGSPTMHLAPTFFVEHGKLLPSPPRPGEQKSGGEIAVADLEVIVIETGVRRTF
jgi:hypothetical protein